MQKRSWLGLFVLSLLIVGMFVGFSGVASAQNGGTAKEAIFGPVFDMFSGWQKGELDVSIAKYAFWILLTLIIFSIVSLIPFLEKQSYQLRTVVSFIIAFLATAYLTPSDIYTMLVSYGALGIVLGAGLPFIILLYSSIELNKSGAGGKILSKLLWVAFILFLVWKLIYGMFFCEISTTMKCIGMFEGWVYIGFIIFAIIYAFFGGERLLVNILFKERIKANAEKLDQGKSKSLLAEAALRDRQAEALESSGNAGDAKRLRRIAKSLRKAAGEK